MMIMSWFVLVAYNAQLRFLGPRRCTHKNDQRLSAGHKDTFTTIEPEETV